MEIKDFISFLGHGPKVQASLEPSFSSPLHYRLAKTFSGYYCQSATIPVRASDDARVAMALMSSGTDRISAYEGLYGKMIMLELQSAGEVKVPIPREITLPEYTEPVVPLSAEL